MKETQFTPESILTNTFANGEITCTKLDEIKEGTSTIRTVSKVDFGVIDNKHTIMTRSVLNRLKGSVLTDAVIDNETIITRNLLTGHIISKNVLQMVNKDIMESIAETFIDHGDEVEQCVTYRQFYISSGDMIDNIMSKVTGVWSDDDVFVRSTSFDEYLDPVMNVIESCFHSWESDSNGNIIRHSIGTTAEDATAVAEFEYVPNSSIVAKFEGIPLEGITTIEYCIKDGDRTPVNYYIKDSLDREVMAISVFSDGDYSINHTLYLENTDKVVEQTLTVSDTETDKMHSCILIRNTYDEHGFLTTCDKDGFIDVYENDKTGNPIKITNYSKSDGTNKEAIDAKENSPRREDNVIKFPGGKNE